MSWRRSVRATPASPSCLQYLWQKPEPPLIRCACLSLVDGVPVYLIDLSASAGSLHLVITIRVAPPPSSAPIGSATGSGATGGSLPPSPPALMIADLMAKVQTIDTTAIVSSMSTALGTNVSVALEAPQQATSQVEYNRLCIRGHYVTAVRQMER